MGQSLNNLFSTINKRNEIEAMQAVQGIHQVLAEKENYLTREKLYQEKMQDKDFAEKENIRKGTMGLLEKYPTEMENFTKANPNFKVTNMDEFENMHNTIVTENQKNQQIKVDEEQKAKDAEATEKEIKSLKKIIGKDVIESGGKLVTFDENDEPVDAYIAAGQKKDTPKMSQSEINIRKKATDYGLPIEETDSVLDVHDKIKDYESNEKTFEELSKDSVVKNMASKTKMIDGVLHTEISKRYYDKLTSSKKRIQINLWKAAKEKKEALARQKEGFEKTKIINGKYYIQDPEAKQLESEMLIDSNKMAPLLTKLNEYNAAKDYLEGIKKPKETGKQEQKQDPGIVYLKDYLGVEIKTAKKDSISYKHNNPGNIKFSEWTKKYGAIKGDKATDGGYFAKFPDMNKGIEAMTNLLKSDFYQRKTVDEALSTWSGKGYDGNLVPELKDKKVKDLSEEELKIVMKNMIITEGMSAGENKASGEQISVKLDDGTTENWTKEEVKANYFIKKPKDSEEDFEKWWNSKKEKKNG